MHVSVCVYVCGVYLQTYTQAHTHTHTHTNINGDKAIVPRSDRLNIFWAVRKNTKNTQTNQFSNIASSHSVGSFQQDDSVAGRPRRAHVQWEWVRERERERERNFQNFPLLTLITSTCGTWPPQSRILRTRRRVCFTIACVWAHAKRWTD